MSEPELIYDFDPRNAPPELLQAIGLVVTAASQTESVLQDFIGAVLGIDNIETRALTAHISVPLKQQILKSVAELNAPHAADVDTIDDLMDAVDAAFKKRNEIVHNAILRNPNTDELMTYREKARGGFQVDLVSISIEQIQNDAAEIYEVGMEMMRFMIMRNLAPRTRGAPIREPLDRRPKARKARQENRRR